MALSSVHPTPPTAPRNRNSPQTTTQAIGDTESTIFEDDSIGPLETIDVTRTLAGKLCGRVNDEAFNQRIVAFMQRMDPAMHVVASVFLLSCLLLFFVADVNARITLSYINGVTGALVLIHGFATLSWDMLCLIFGTFEFWFLYFINTTNNIWFNILFRDERMVAMVVTGATFVLSLCADANIYTRRFATRLLVIASPGLLFGLTATALHFPPDLNYVSFHVFGLRIDAVDLLVNGNLIISYFTAIRVIRSQHLVLSRGPIHRVKCDLYFPVCHLVPHSRRRFTMSTSTELQQFANAGPFRFKKEQQMELIHHRSGQGINVNHVLIPALAKWIQRRICPGVLNTIGIVGIFTSVIAFVWRATAFSPISSTTDDHLLLLSVLGVASTVVFTTVHAVNYQRTLLKRVLVEVDAWFVSVQITMVMVGTCDILDWDARRSLLAFTVWIWSHWIIFLDALPPVTRRSLGYSRRLTLLVNFAMMIYPLLLGYWIYFSNARPFLKNRVILEVHFGEVDMRAEVMGFLASKLFTLWMWMARFFWRELMRPSDAFKMIKHRVFYRVHVCAITGVFICGMLFIVSDLMWRDVIITISTMLFLPPLFLHGALVGWDMLRIVLATFEFWFLFVVGNCANVAWCLLENDTRIVAMAAGGTACLVPLFLDANIHMRAVVLRMFVLGSPALMYGLVVSNMRLAVDQTYRSFTFFGMSVGTLDLLNHGASTIAFFMATRIFRNRHVVFSNRPDGILLCGMFRPVCEFVESTQTQHPKPRNCSAGSSTTPLEFVGPPESRVIDASDTVLPAHYLRSSYTRLALAVLNLTGLLGCVALLVLLFRLSVLDDHDFAHPAAVVAVVATSLFVLVHALHYQRSLARRLLTELDAWFVSAQASIVAAIASDAFGWDHRAGVVAAAWLWCHWALFLDALPPATRARLRLSRALVLLVHAALVAFPLLLAHAVYVARADVRSRELLRVRVGGREVREETLRLLPSRLATLWLWMGRGAWRELRRPRDALKVLSFRVLYRFAGGGVH